ncbi:hypothetical protein C5F59_005510 [Streptomyces sp. QL37]|uniref:hypothetical protein n=1 Tax=Streptomyces sp. QL37 TaxID=2093747 RepID=UPI001651B66F|nr:hypothetical protein [Streptomyces sp. QL37]
MRKWPAPVLAAVTGTDRLHTEGKGGHLDGGPHERWTKALRDPVVENGIHHILWCLNPDTGDTEGLLGDDRATWDEAEYALLKPAPWQSGGKFVSLDHEVGRAAKAARRASARATSTAADHAPRAAHHPRTSWGADETPPPRHPRALHRSQGSAFLVARLHDGEPPVSRG